MWLELAENEIAVCDKDDDDMAEWVDWNKQVRAWHDQCVSTDFLNFLQQPHHFYSHIPHKRKVDVVWFDPLYSTCKAV